MKRELGIWKRLDHPNIVPLLGTAQGDDFGSDHLCMVSVWMPHGTLAQYVNQCDNVLSLPDRIRLVSTRDPGTVVQFMMRSQIAGSAAGLEYCRFSSSPVVGLCDIIPQCIQNLLFTGISTLCVVNCLIYVFVYILVGQYFNR